MQEISDHTFSGIWNIWTVKEMKPSTMYIYVEPMDNDEFAIYPFFDDGRFNGTYAKDFYRQDNFYRFHDNNSGIEFSASLKDKQIDLKFIFAGKTLNQSVMEPFPGQFPQPVKPIDKEAMIIKPKELDDGWEIGDLNQTITSDEPLLTMIDDIHSQTLTKTHSVLIAKSGKLIFESYFSGFNEDMPHTMRSASKSMSSALIGIAEKNGDLKNEHEYIKTYMPKKYQHLFKKDEKKGRIRIVDLLTMSSGLDAIDHGVDWNSVASEGRYQRSSDWLKTVLEAPMIYEPGTHSNYGSGNSFLLGIVLQHAIEQPVDLFIDSELFKPLGIKNYIVQNDDKGEPYFGGGMQLTSRDMLKFGQLYLNGGTWNGKQILTKNWIEKSWAKSFNLENRKDKIEYGYQWWRMHYSFQDRTIISYECRGAGGQYIFVIPELDMVAVVTSGNFRNGRFWQPEKIMQDYILKALE
jgi:CubicO group peptidase (beta-lactamase class C family)